VLGAAVVLAATTQGPISTVVLMMELTGRNRSFILPLLVAVATATIVARTIEPRSIYDARLTDEEMAARQKARDRPRSSPEFEKRWSRYARPVGGSWRMEVGGRWVC